MHNKPVEGRIVEKAARHPTVGQWTSSVFLGWFVGIFLIISLSSLLDSMGIDDMQFYLGIGMGAGVGFTQWLRLRKSIAISNAWIWLSVAGLGIPFVVLDLVLAKGSIYKLPLGVALGGLAVGFLQFLLLKKHSKQAGMWIWGSVAGWTLAIVSVIMIDYTKYLAKYVPLWVLALINLLLILSGGIILGVITGIALKKILNENPAPPEVAETAQ